MYFKKGRYRFVFVFPSLGIAVKFPVVCLFMAIKGLFWDIRGCEFYQAYKRMTVSVDAGAVIMGYKNILFGGVVANWREFLFYCRTKNVFLQQTYFSFFGLVNIQKAGEPSGVGVNTFWPWIREITGWHDRSDVGVYESPHHFMNPDNYCRDNCKLKFLDYGDRKVQAVIVKWGARIQESFDPSRDWSDPPRTETK